MFETPLHWINELAPQRLALTARPRGGDDLQNEVRSWRHAHVDIVVSLLESHEVRELELSAESELCRENGLTFFSYPIKDRGTPNSNETFKVLVSQLGASLNSGKSVAIHCRAGIGRTGLLAGCILHLMGIPSKDIFRILSKARGVGVPDTAEQIEWVEGFAQRTKSSV